MKTFLTNKSTILLSVVILFFGLFACEKNATEPENDSPPPLPPVESMQFDLSLFDSPSNSSLAKATISKQNFAAAALRVFIIKTTVTIAAIVPTAVFVAAIHQEPVLQEDGKFHWIYTVQNGSNTFSADLAGWVDIQTNEIVWEMYVSSNTHSPELDQFLWYEGRSKIGNKEGWWLFYDDRSPSALAELLKIDWQILDEDHRELILSNVNQSDESFGDSLTYTMEINENFLMFFDASENQSSTIFWDTQSGAGFIEWFDYKNGAKSYWDENQDDTSGPPA